MSGFGCIAVIPFQQSLAFQTPSQTMGNGVGELIEFAVGWGFNPAEPCGPCTVHIDTIKKQHESGARGWTRDNLRGLL